MLNDLHTRSDLFSIRIQNLTKKVAVAIQCGGHFLF